MTINVFERQLNASVAEFGAGEQSIRLILKDMASAARKQCDECAGNEDENAQGIKP